MWLLFDAASRLHSLYRSAAVYNFYTDDNNDDNKIINIINIIIIY